MSKSAWSILPSPSRNLKCNIFTRKCNISTNKFRFSLPVRFMLLHLHRYPKHNLFTLRTNTNRKQKRHVEKRTASFLYFHATCVQTHRTAASRYRVSIAVEGMPLAGVQDLRPHDIHSSKLQERGRHLHHPITPCPQPAICLGVIRPFHPSLTDSAQCDESSHKNSYTFRQDLHTKSAPTISHKCETAGALSVKCHLTTKARSILSASAA